MTFVGLLVHNLAARKLRAGLTAVAVALGVTTVVTLGIVTGSLRTTAVAVLRTGRADFTVAQKGVSDVLYSSLDEAQVARVARLAQVESALGVLVATTRLNADNPLFLELGLPPDKFGEFGVQIVAGGPFEATAPDELLLGWRAAQNLDKHVGDIVTVDDQRYRVVGIYSTGQVFGDSAAMFPLVPLQASERKPGIVTLVFVRAKPGVDLAGLRARIERDNPQLTTVRSESEFGRVDRNLALITAADQGATILAVLIGAVIVMNTMLLSFFQRIREFGVLRAIGWARLRLVALVVGEALLISLAGAAVGMGLSYGAVRVLEHVPDLAGILHARYRLAHFARALYTAAAMALLGGLYPALRAALLVPLEALRRE